MTRRPNPRSGFALLIIYAMAAVIAIMLFMEMPRVAFEAQRDKEQLLIDRGEQYSRAVTLFVRKFNNYPPSIDALNNTQNLRFLRNKYIDPMTGKDEWRLIHVGPGGVFTDSLVYNKKKDDDKASEPQNFITEGQQTGGNQVDPSQGGANIGTRTRPSDQPGAPGDPNNQQLDLPQADVAPMPGVPQPGMPQPGLNQPGLPQFDANGQPIPNTGMPQQGFPGQMQPGLPPGQPPGLPPGFPQGAQLPPGMNMPGGAQPGQMPNGTPTLSGTNLINQILTTPRPGGMPGQLNPQTGQPTIDQFGNPVAAGSQTGIATPAAAPVAAPAAAAAPAIGGGIAGVASKFEQKGIKIYKERKKYNEWEFVYDITKDPSRTGVAGAAPVPPGGAATGQQPQAQPGQQQGQQPGQAQQPGQTQPGVQQPMQPAMPATPPTSQ